MGFTPFEWQEADLRVLAENNFTALLNIQTGGGKSVLSVWAAQRSGAEVVLVVAPLSTHASAWVPTVQDVLGVAVRKVGNGSKAEREALRDLELGEPGWYITTQHFMAHPKTDISNWWPDMLIADEIHEYNRPGGAQMKRWVALGGQSRMRLALSGTPVRRDFTRMWSNMRFLWPELSGRHEVAYANHWVWCRDRMTSETVYTNQRDQFGRPKRVNQWMAEKEPGRLLSEAPCVIQHFRREACCEWHPNGFLSLDEPQVIERVVPLLPAQKRAIHQLEHEFIAWLDDNPLVVDLTITQKQRIRQMCLGVPRIETVLNDLGEERQTVHFDSDCKSPVADEILSILEHLDEGEPVVVYLESQRFAAVLVEKLRAAGYTAGEYSGKTKQSRDALMASFGSEVQVLVAVASAFGTGTDGAQRVCSTEIWAEIPVDDTVTEQTEARLNRMGARGQVQRYYLYDDLGIALGKFNAQIEKRLEVRKSTKKHDRIAA